MFCCCCCLFADLQALKEKTLVLKEGVTYRLKIDFKVRRADVATEERFTVLQHRSNEQTDDQVFTVSDKEKEGERKRESVCVC